MHLTVTRPAPPPLPELDRAALVTADLALLDEAAFNPAATGADLTAVAIKAYLWHVQSYRPLNDKPDAPLVGPTLEEYRAARMAVPT